MKGRWDGYNEDRRKGRQESDLDGHEAWMDFSLRARGPKVFQIPDVFQIWGIFAYTK